MKTKISSLKPALMNDHQLTDLLYNGLEDDNQPGECIFVPGSSKAVDYRLPKALELYRQGRSKKLLFSGGVIWDGNSITEAETLKVKALEEGVFDHDILIETQSLHTKENVLASLLILDRAIGLHHMNNLIVVTAPYHLRRMQLTLKTYMPAWITYSLVAANDKTTRKENWHLNPYGRKRVETEAAKLIHYVKKGIIMDDIVEISGIGND